MIKVAAIVRTMTAVRELFMVGLNMMDEMFMRFPDNAFGRLQVMLSICSNSSPVRSFCDDAAEDNNQVVSCL